MYGLYIELYNKARPNPSTLLNKRLSIETNSNYATSTHQLLTVQTVFALPSNKLDSEPIAFGRGQAFAIFEVALVFVGFRLSRPKTF